MAMEEDAGGRDYRDCLDVREYLRTFYSEMHTDWQATFRARMMNDFYRKYGCKWDRKTAKLLDFGAGAVIMNYISGGPHFSEIVHAAYTAEERQEIEQWRNDVEGSHDWSPIIKYVVNEVEEIPGEVAWRERAALLRSKLTIQSCDIHAQHPIESVNAPGTFSVVCTSFVLESVCTNLKALNVGIKKLVKLLKPGGYLVMSFVEEQSFYTIGKEKWPVLPVTLHQVKDAIEAADCIILMAERDPTPIHLMENQTIGNQIAGVFLVAFRARAF